MSYQTETNYIIELLKCSVTEEIPSVPPENIDWDQVFFIARKHRICSTLYFGIQKLPKSCQQFIGHFDQYVLAYKKTLVLDANRTYELENLKQDFETNGIDYILLKGSITKHLYPDTSMRVMSDIDVFYRNASTDVIVSILSKNGFQITKREPKEVAFFKTINEIKVEMQTQLIDEGYELWFEYLKNIWNKCIQTGNTHEYKMTDEDFYIYHILHMAKHFKNGGIGLIHVLDVWILINTYSNMNYEYVKHELQYLGLDIFENNLRMLVNNWFGNYEPDQDTTVTLELLGTYLFSGGAFGLKSQREVNAVVERNDKNFSWRKKIFPNMNIMIDYYGSTIKKHPYLLPLYWIRLNFKRLFIDRKKLKNNINLINSISNQQVEDTRELMKRCGL